MIDIIVPSYNRSEKLQKCLDSLCGQTHREFKVLCVLRPTDIPSNQIASQYKQRLNIEILPITKDGVIAAENLAISKTQGEYTFFLDDDAYAPPDWIANLLKHFSHPPYPVAVGGRDFVLGSPEQSNLHANLVGKLTYYGKLFGNHHKKSEGIKSVNTLKGVNMAVQTAFLHYLDSNLHSSIALGNGSQWELDLFLKLRHYGEIIFDPNICVQHDSNHDHFIKDATQLNDAHNIAYVYQKHFNSTRRLVFFLYATVIGNTQIVGPLKLLTLIKKNPRSAIKKWLLSQKGLLNGIRRYQLQREKKDQIVKRPIVYLCPNGYLGGAENFVINCCSHHSPPYYPIIIFFSTGQAVDKAKELKIPFIVMKNRPKLANPLKLFQAVRELKKIIQQLNPVLVHSTMAYAQILFGLTGLKQYPNLWFQHGPVGGLLDFAAALFKVDQVLFNSKQLQKIHNHKTPLFTQRLPSKRITLGVNIPSSPLSQKKGTETMTFGSAGRICWAKGQFNIVKAYHQFTNETLVQNKLILVGGPNSVEDKAYDDKINAYIEEHQLQDKIERWSHQKQLENFFQQIDVFIHAPNIPEPFGLVVAEAMAYKKLIIGPSQGGISTFLKNQQTGYTFDSLDINSVSLLKSRLAEVAGDKLNNPKKIERIATQARELIQQDYNLSKMTQKLEHTYSRIMA